VNESVTKKLIKKISIGSISGRVHIMDEVDANVTNEPLQVEK